MGLVDKIKLEYLKNELHQRQNPTPNRQIIQEILGVGYVQAGNYLKALRGEI
jgi:hypothetical protein